MNWISILFFSISFFILGSILKKGVDIVSPGRIFAFTWSVVLGLANLKLSRIQAEWSIFDWVFIMMGPSAFLLGIYIINVMNIGVRLHSVNDIRTIIRNQKIDEKKLFLLIIILFVTYIIGYSIIYLVKGYIPIFSNRPAAARIDYYIFGVGLLTHNMPIILFFSVFYLIVVPNNKNRKLVLKLFIFITTMTYFFLLQRYQLLMVSVMIFIYYTTRYVKFKTVIIFLLIAAIIIYFISSMRAGKIVQSVLYITSEMKFSSKYAIFTEPYMYLVMNVENFIRAVNHLDHNTYGYFTFDFALAITGLKHWISNYFNIVENPYLISGYNTYTFFWIYYRDFGIIGLTFIPLIYGLLVGGLYYSIRRYPTLETVSFYGIVTFLILFSFFLNPVGFLWFVYILIWFVFIFKVIRIDNIDNAVLKSHY